MTITSRAGLLGLLLALAALSGSAAQAASTQVASTQLEGASIDARLKRISAAFRDRGVQIEGMNGSAEPTEPMLLSAGFVNGGRGGWVNAPAYGGFANAHPYYGAGRFVNGGGGFVNGRYGGGGFANGYRGGAAFRNW
jgi:rSAM-associated Gly-rich repeat protein